MMMESVAPRKGRYGAGCGSKARLVREGANRRIGSQKKNGRQFDDNDEKPCSCSREKDQQGAEVSARGKREEGNQRKKIAEGVNA